MPAITEISALEWFVFGAIHGAAMIVFLVVRPLSRAATKDLHGHSATSWTVPPVWVGVWNGFFERMLMAGVTFFVPGDIVLAAVAWTAIKTAIGWRGIWGEDMARRVRGTIGLWATVLSLAVGVASGAYLRWQT